MTCPHCLSTSISKRQHRTSLGYRTFSCRACRLRFNQRTGSPFNDLQFPTHVVLLAVLWRLRYKLGFREVAELLLQRGFEVSHETIRNWEFRFAPMVSERLRAKRRGHAGRSWYLDETYVKVSGRWCYLYRAIDRDGNLLDSMLSKHRDRQAARRFLRRLLDASPRRPLRLDHRQAPSLQEGRSLDRRSQGAAPAEPVPQQPYRAGSSATQATLLPDAGFRPIRFSLPFLHCLRRAAPLPACPKSPRRKSFSITQSPDLQQQMVNPDGRVGRLTRAQLLSQLASVPGKP